MTARSEALLAPVREFVARFRLVDLGLPFKRVRFIAYGDFLYVAVDLKVRDREAPSVSTEIEFRQRYSWELLARTAEGAQEWLREMTFRMLRDAAIHEVAEAFHVDGVRIRDPHRDDPK